MVVAVRTPWLSRLELAGKEGPDLERSNFIGNIGALIIRIGFWCLLYYTYNKGHPK